MWGLANIGDPFLVREVLRILMSATSRDNSAIALVMANIDIPAIVNLIDCDTPEHQRLAIEIVGNLCCGPSFVADEILKTNCLLKVRTILATKPKLVPMACRLITNLSMSHVLCIQKLIDLNIVEELTNVVQADVEFDVSFMLNKV